MSDVKEMSVEDKKEWIKFKLKIIESLTSVLNEPQQQLLLDSIMADVFGWEVVNSMRTLDSLNKSVNVSDIDNILERFKANSDDEISFIKEQIKQAEEPIWQDVGDSGDEVHI